jgi:hypothetical protein
MTVTLWLAEDRLGHPFDGVGRKTVLMMVLVELDEAEEAIDQKARALVEAAGERPVGPLRSPPSSRPSYAAAMLCKNPQFWDWMRTVDELIGGLPINEEGAAVWIRGYLKVGSRGDLDRDPELEKVFRTQIQRPFTAWAANLD